jgi:hypothetical protein
MRYLLLSSYLFFVPGCSFVYKHLQKTRADAACVLQFKPRFRKALYNTQVDVTGKHLGGILLIKTMPDSSTRMVFSNEIGFKFFDFEFSASGDFKVYYILKQMDKKAVLKTLRKDFELLLMQHLDTQNAFVLKDDQLLYYGFPQKKGTYYYITDSACSQLLRIEKSSRRKPFVKAIMQNYSDGIPDTIGISHTNFNFSIGLKRLKQ